MLPSSTVENYLKAIYLGVTALQPGQRLMPMGQLAAALGVAPGTVTTMVRTLAESGLVEYEPYSGVTLTPAGQKLAALVLRRHRLVELFLVKVMGFKWDEVHDEAELLEHVVSDRLIDRIDDMLGRPDADPHGDPIPNQDGDVKQLALDNLMTCPLHTPVTVTRVVDQDKLFLRFIENHDLKPGQSIEVEDRDPIADSVRVRASGDRQVTIGTRAASKVLVQVARAILLMVCLGGTASAQSEPFEILDNSFLVEEAFNQEGGIFQNIFNVRRAEGGSWEASFTQEWPFFGQRHQLSYSVPYSSIANGSAGFGDVMLNYRLQATMESGGVPAFSPRLSLIVPSGNAAEGLGGGSVGWQVNLPLSKQLNDVYLHWNAGVTHLPNAEVDNGTRSLTTPHASASAIVRLSPMFNLMFEAVTEWEPLMDGPGRQAVVTLGPGFRTGWNSGDAQTIVGLSVPIAISDGQTEVSVFGYFSYELPFITSKP